MRIRGKPDGHEREIVWQHVKIEMPILSTSALTDDPKHPSDILYQKDGGQVIEVDTSNKSGFIRHGKVYFMKTYMKRSAFGKPKQGFVRHGVKA